MTDDGFEIFERVTRNSVHAQGHPAVSLRKTGITFNQQACEALGVKVGDQLAILFHRGEGLIAFEKPARGYAPSMSAKLGKSGASSGATLNLGGFLAWAGIDKSKKEAFKIYRLGYDERTEMHMFKLPAGSWEKPDGAPGGSGARRELPAVVGERLSRARDKSRTGVSVDGRPTAQRRSDLPAASPHRQPGISSRDPPSW